MTNGKSLLGHFCIDETYCSRLHSFLRREARRAAVLLDLVVELVCAGLDGHARAVEALWEQHPLPAQAVVRAGKLQLHQYMKGLSALEKIAVSSTDMLMLYHSFSCTFRERRSQLGQFRGARSTDMLGQCVLLRQASCFTLSRQEAPW